MSKPNPLDFPPPDQWATYMKDRSPQFKTHKNLGQCKNSLTGKCYYGTKDVDVASTDMWIYEWDTEEQVWVERYEMREGDIKQQHILWKTKVPRSGRVSKEVPQKVLDKTIASIMKAAQ